jgi:hypothetical protein
VQGLQVGLSRRLITLFIEVLGFPGGRGDMFRLRFALSRISYWADRYSYPGERKLLTGPVARARAAAVSATVTSRARIEAAVLWL